jgi:hypothetical protein
MKITLENLQKLVRETLSETYFGTTTRGGLASPAFKPYGPLAASSTEIPIDPVDLAESIRALIGGDAGWPIGEWGDEALNDASKAAADALISTSQTETMTGPARIYEQKDLIKEARTLLEDIDSGAIDTAKLSDAFKRIIDILDSMDMSLDLIYSALSGYEGPISAVRGLQKSYGRAMGAVTHGGKRRSPGDEQ